MDIMDVGGWEIDEEKQVSGTLEKYWLIHPETGTHYLFKIPRLHTGEVWAEKFVCELGTSLDLLMMNANIAQHDGRMGILAKNFRAKNEEFFEGGDLLLGLIERFNRHNLKDYTITNIAQVLRDHSFEKDFISMLVFDALIANQDRHCDNWGILWGDNGSRFSPLYDNGPALGCLSHQEKIEKMMVDHQMFVSFTNRSISLIGLPNKKKPKYLELLNYIFLHFQKPLKYELGRINLVNQSLLLSILDKVPETVMPALYKEWVIKLLKYRKEWLLHWYQRRGGL